MIQSVESMSGADNPGVCTPLLLLNGSDSSGQCFFLLAASGSPSVTQEQLPY